eukprot:gnl/MRDRNA2_/MRDRNA2_92955_c0_seq1.p1 gnl/MRDRNA2_/MRDRNA2_92955_c0~~gnl/MRDRNA2_/MRDRNA2_92955_c0_seq1.p1  ORF type:complete len:388 (+),score=69.34 gnl/MRDRNA2_/MRDRNA2_92955_c0_seq1:76-1239(+)
MTMWRSKLGNTFPRAEIERLDAEHHRILKKLRSQPGNDKCAECGTKENTWSSVNLGVFLCVQCADVHRALGTHISKVKGCGGTYLWGPDEIAQMQSLGNGAWGSRGAQINSSMGKQEQLRICRKKYENQQPNAKGLDVATKACNTSSAPQVLSRAARDGCVDAVQSASNRFSQTSASDDLDSFFGDCLKPSELASKQQPLANQAMLSTPVQMPSSSQPIDLDWCTASTQPNLAPSDHQPSNLDWCFPPSAPIQGGNCAPAPPGQGAIARSLSGISGFDFDSFFDECLKSSTSCDAGTLPVEKPQSSIPSSDVGKGQSHHISVSQQFDPFQICQQVQVSLPTQSAQPQPPQTGFAGMMFDSDAFFDEMLGSTSSRHSKVSLQSASMIW